jgi:peptidyl-prolyl cis-trans isomerase D
VLRFNGDKWLDQIEEPAEEDLASYFTTNEARYQPAPDPEAETEPAAVTLDDVRDRVLADLRMERARRVAEERASAFTLTLWNQKIPYGSAEYIALLEEFRVDETPLPPYSREQPPRTEAPRDMLESMWVYVESSFRYFSDLARTSQGAAVGVLLDRMEQRMPPFEEVQDAVAEDYISAETQRLFAERGNEIRATLQENVDAFADTASELGLSIEEMEPFVGREVPFQIRFNGIWEQIQFLDEGEMSAMIINGNRGSFALLTDKEVPEVTTDSDAFVTFAQQRRDAIRSSLGWTRLSEIKDRSLTSLFGTDTLPQ